MQHKEIMGSQCVNQPEMAAEMPLMDDENIDFTSLWQTMNDDERALLEQKWEVVSREIDQILQAAITQQPDAQAPAAAGNSSLQPIRKNSRIHHKPIGKLFYVDNPELEEVADVPDLFYLNSKGKRCVERNGRLRPVGTFSYWSLNRDAHLQDEAINEALVTKQPKKLFFLDTDEREVVPAGLVQLTDVKKKFYVTHNGQKRPVGSDSTWVKTRRKYESNPDIVIPINAELEHREDGDYYQGKKVFTLSQVYNGKRRVTKTDADTGKVKMKKTSSASAAPVNVYQAYNDKNSDETIEEKVQPAPAAAEPGQPKKMLSTKSRAIQKYFLDNNKRELVPEELQQYNRDKNKLYVIHNGKIRMIGSRNQWHRSRRRYGEDLKEFVPVDAVLEHKNDGDYYQGYKVTVFNNRYYSQPHPDRTHKRKNTYLPYHDGNSSALFHNAKVARSDQPGLEPGVRSDNKLDM